MSISHSKAFARKRLHLLVCAALGIPFAAQARDSIGTDEGVLLNEIIITGLRQSLEDASMFKRESVNFTDAVFSEDVGKFPDLNIAEAINRVPGIQLSREIDGSALIEYFQPLLSWLEEQNKGRPIGW